MPASRGGGAGAPAWVPVPGVHVPSHRFCAPRRQHCPPSVSSFGFSLSRVHQPHHGSSAPRPIHPKVNTLLKTNLLGTCAWCPPPRKQTKVLGVFPRHPWESVFYFCMEFLSVNTHIFTDLCVLCFLPTRMEASLLPGLGLFRSSRSPMPEQCPACV